MDTNTRLNPTRINPLASASNFAALSIEAIEQADLQSAIEEGSKNMADLLSLKFPALYETPALDLDDFEAVYQWFLS